METVLISGAGVAGTALAYWLAHHGFAPTVVEKAPRLRPGGQAVDVRGVALDVVDRMGILPAVRAARTRMRGMSVVDGAGNELMRTEEMTYSGGRFDSGDVEVLRDDLVRLLYERGRPGVEYVFGDAITALHDDDHGVRVTFERGATRTFDVVVGADGLHSAVRRLAFGPEERFLRHLGTYLAVFSAPNFLGLDNWQVWLRDEAGGGAVYPVRDNAELRVTLGFAADRLDYDHRDNRQQMAIVADRLADAGWETPRLLKAMWEAPDFYFDAMAQTHLDRWSAGRVVLLGDAGYCPSPLSGQGTSLALAGGYVLAAELAGAGGDHRAGFAGYERRMRPFVALNQALATENPEGPASEESIAMAKNAMSLDQ
jgi:2-polyprenyl-6-methoxyphenol hydroxylase-like FAD-dependent oxidoreductase